MLMCCRRVKNEHWCQGDVAGELPGQYGPHGKWVESKLMALWLTPHSQRKANGGISEDVH